MTNFGPTDDFVGEDWVVAPPVNPQVGIVPQAGSHPVQFCRRDEENLLVEFRNSGQIQAPPEYVTVRFIFDDGPNVSVTQLRQPIPAGQSLTMPFAIPDGWFRGGGSDPDFVVLWSNQAPVYGRCIS